MRVSTIERILRLLGSIHSTLNVNVSQTWGQCSCPLARYTHDKGHDHAPSFGVTLSAGMPMYHCFTCKYKGSLVSLVKTMHEFGGIDSDLKDAIIATINLEKYDNLSEVENKLKQFEIPPNILSSFGSYHPYWISRGITEKQIKKYRLGFDGETERIVLPWFDWDGNLVGAQSRAIFDDVKPKYIFYPPNFDRSHHLWGVHTLTGREDYIVVVEGFMDKGVADNYLDRDIYGVLALSVATPSLQQAKILKMIGKKFIIMLDNDKSGDEGTMKLMNWLKGCDVKTVPLKGRFSNGETYEFKDPGEAGSLLPRIMEENTLTAQDKLTVMLKQNLEVLDKKRHKR